jgi:hypothetical protein
VREGQTGDCIWNVIRKVPTFDRVFLVLSWINAAEGRKLVMKLESSGSLSDRIKDYKLPGDPRWPEGAWRAVCLVVNLRAILEEAEGGE